MNITLCNGKGGTGKTTLAVLLAHALAEAGKHVAVLDTDAQGTATKWLAGLDGSKVVKYESSTEYDAVLIDTSPNLATGGLAESVRRSDVVIVVSSPSPADLWTSRDTAEIVKQHLQPRARARVLFNKVQRNTILARGLPDLAARIGLAPLKTTIGRKQCYQHAALLGWRALSTDAKEELYRAALEIVAK